MLTPRRAARPSLERGVMLLEALIAILIFSIGILGLVAMQQVAIGTISDAKYRSDASFLADQIMSQIWVDRGNMANYAYPGGSATALTAWIASVQASLPQGAATIAIPPAAYPAGTVQVTVQWQQPGNPNVRQYTTMSFITNP